MIALGATFAAVLAVDTALVLLVVAVVALCITTIAMIVSAPPRGPRLGVPGRRARGRSSARPVVAPRRAITGRAVRIGPTKELPAARPTRSVPPASNRHLLSPESAAAEDYVESLVRHDPTLVANLLTAWMNDDEEYGAR